MSQQPTLFSPQAPVTPPRLAASTPQDAKPPRQSPRWLQRLDLFVRVIVRLYLGLVIVVLPWMHFWDDNIFIPLDTHLSPILLNGVARGMVSGLGLLNIWIAIHDAIHYREG